MARPLAALAVLVLLVPLGACRQSRPIDAHSTRSARSGPSPRVYGNDQDENLQSPVASINGVGIAKSELSDFWFDRYRDEYRRTLDELIDDKVARTYAGRTGLRVPASILDAAVDKEVEARKEVQKDVYGEGLSLAAGPSFRARRGGGGRARGR